MSRRRVEYIRAKGQRGFEQNPHAVGAEKVEKKEKDFWKINNMQKNNIIPFLVFLLLCCYSLPCLGYEQGVGESDSVYVARSEDDLYTGVSLNMMTYRIHRMIEKNKKALDRGLYVNGVVDLHSTPILSCESNEKYALEFRVSHFYVPDSSFNASFILVEFKWNSYGIFYDFMEKRRFSAPPSYDSRYSHLEKKGLIAVARKDSRSIIFVSGYLFLDNMCSEYFAENHFSEVAIRDYVKLRFYNYDPVIERIEIEKKECIFYSNVMRKRYIVQILKDEDGYRATYDRVTELPEVEEKEKGE